MAPTLPLDPQTILDSFGMAPHPEGGWYAETYRAPSEPGSRSAVTAIYFLLKAGERSHWHTVDATEIWLWHAGSPVRLQMSMDGRQTETILLGADIAAGERPQAVVPVGCWQAAESSEGWGLVSCIVAPGFEFRGFRMAPAAWSPGLDRAERKSAG
jgi:predicted cupin superfamily sugar epimerase